MVFAPSIFTPSIGRQTHLVFMPSHSANLNILIELKVLQIYDNELVLNMERYIIVTDFEDNP